MGKKVWKCMYMYNKCENHKFISFSNQTDFRSALRENRRLAVANEGEGPHRHRGRGRRERRQRVLCREQHRMRQIRARRGDRR